MADPDKVVRYRNDQQPGNGLPSIPNRDITQFEYDGLTKQQQEDVDNSGLYNKTAPAGTSNKKGGD